MSFSSSSSTSTMDSDDDKFGFGFGSGSGSGSALPPALVSLTPFARSTSPSRRRLSSCFTQPSEPVRANRHLAWVDLHGRLVGADAATSAKTIGAEEAAAWEMFTPMHRVLTVAVVAAAAADSRKEKEVTKLRKSVQLRDQVLLSMQQKLDNLCEQVNYFKDQPEVQSQNDGFVTKGAEYGCKLCQHHHPPSNGSLFDISTKGLNLDEEVRECEVEPDERRMSDLSDWAPSVTSSVDFKLDSLAIEHDINSLRKECEEKDVTIKELSTFIQSTEVLGSKRVAELEDIIRRKNVIINKLRKDIITLEQKVVNLARLRRSSSAASSNLQRLPIMADNVLYDMDSTTDPSSDSDTSPRKQTQALALKMEQISVQTSDKASTGDLKCGQFNNSTLVEQNHGPRSTSPLKENIFNQMPNSVPSRKPKRATYARGENRSRSLPSKSKEVAVIKRWL